MVVLVRNHTKRLQEKEDRQILRWLLFLLSDQPNRPHIIKPTEFVPPRPSSKA